MAKKKPTRRKREIEEEPESPAGEPDAQLSRFVKLEQQVIHRRKLKDAPYNPRVMQEEARRDLKANIERVGLVESLVWNKRSGNLVGGHQRISILDSLMGTDNYLVPVNVVDMDDKTEKEQNIALNNENLTGDWDLAKLGSMFKGGEVEIPHTGFSPAQCYQMFGDNPMTEQPAQLEALAAQMREARERYNQIKGAIRKRDDPDFYLVVFAGVEERTAFLDMLGLPQNRYVDGSALALRFQSLQKGGGGNP